MVHAAAPTPARHQFSHCGHCRRSLGRCRCRGCGLEDGAPRPHHHTGGSQRQPPDGTRSEADFLGQSRGGFTPPPAPPHPPLVLISPVPCRRPPPHLPAAPATAAAAAAGSRRGAPRGTSARRAAELLCRRRAVGAPAAVAVRRRGGGAGREGSGDHWKAVVLPIPPPSPPTLAPRAAARAGTTAGQRDGQRRGTVSRAGPTRLPTGTRGGRGVRRRHRPEGEGKSGKGVCVCVLLPQPTYVRHPPQQGSRRRPAESAWQGRPVPVAAAPLLGTPTATAAAAAAAAIATAPPPPPPSGRRRAGGGWPPPRGTAHATAAGRRRHEQPAVPSPLAGGGGGGLAPACAPTPPPSTVPRVRRGRLPPRTLWRLRWQVAAGKRGGGCATNARCRRVRVVGRGGGGPRQQRRREEAATATAAEARNVLMTGIMAGAEGRDGRECRPCWSGSGGKTTRSEWERAGVGRVGGGGEWVEVRSVGGARSGLGTVRQLGVHVGGLNGWGAQGRCHAWRPKYFTKERIPWVPLHLPR